MVVGCFSAKAAQTSLKFGITWAKKGISSGQLKLSGQEEYTEDCA